ncbi:hypothetical protein NMY22_g7932 [Coprinellus aureogranulatus]|nr:hypothetical protein NMY22_g7932 [Coprinellus aureogranulatus]
MNNKESGRARQPALSTRSAQKFVSNQPPLRLEATMVFGPLSVSLAPYVQSSKTLSKWVTPFANWYANAMRYRQYGFKYDDLGALHFFLIS